MDRIEIGIIVKPQGIKGEVKLKSFTDDNARFLKLKAVYIDDLPVKVLSARLGGGDVFLTLADIADRDAAERLRGKSLYVDRSESVIPENGRFLICDVIGCKVVGQSGKIYGVVSDVLQHGAADVFLLDCGTMFPFLEAVANDVDIVNKIITVSDERMGEVAVYAD